MGRRRRSKMDLGLPFVTEFLVTPRPKPKTRIANLAPYRYDEIQTRGAVEDAIAEGNHDPALVAVEVAERLYSGNALFPPGPDDVPSSQVIWALVVDMVNTVFATRTPSTLKRSQKPGIVWELRNIGDPGYPWEEPSLNIDNGVIPGTFVDLNRPGAPEDFDALIRAYVENALRTTDKNPALAQGSSTTSKRLRREARKLFNGIQWHDALYTHHGAPQEWMLNEHGRALNWERSHSNNSERIAKGQSPKRAIDLFGEMISHEGGHAMLLWVPANDRAALDDRIPTIRPLQWKDGSSTQEPPPVIQKLGVDVNGIEVGGRYG